MKHRITCQCLVWHFMSNICDQPKLYICQQNVVNKHDILRFYASLLNSGWSNERFDVLFG